MTPSNCTTTCFDFLVSAGTPESDTLSVAFADFDPRLGKVLTLLDPRVTLKASVSTGFETPELTLMATGGSFSSRMIGDEMDVAFSVDMVTSMGDRISITNGTDVVHGENGTRCNAD
jgi:hypothetical protein